MKCNLLQCSSIPGTCPESLPSWSYSRANTWRKWNWGNSTLHVFFFQWNQIPEPLPLAPLNGDKRRPSSLMSNRRWSLHLCRSCPHLAVELPAPSSAHLWTRRQNTSPNRGRISFLTRRGRTNHLLPEYHGLRFGPADSPTQPLCTRLRSERELKIAAWWSQRGHVIRKKERHTVILRLWLCLGIRSLKLSEQNWWQKVSLGGIKSSLKNESDFQPVLAPLSTRLVTPTVRGPNRLHLCRR